MIIGNDYRALKSQLSSGTRLSRPMFCPQRLFPFILMCWNEDPSERPSFTEIKEHMYKDPVFPQDYVTHDDNENTLSVPSSYEIMRRQYETIQRSNPVYLSMAIKPNAFPDKTKDGSQVDDKDLSEQINLPSTSYDIDTTLDDAKTNKRAYMNKEVGNSTSNLLKFLSQPPQDFETINV